MAYAILRFAKHKGGASKALSAHHERTKEEYASNPDIDKSRIAQNYHLVTPRWSYEQEIRHHIRMAGCRVRKDSVKFVDTLVTVSPEFAMAHDAEMPEYFNRAFEFLKERVGEENIFSAVVHMDEKTPHMHLCFVPLTKDKRLSAKEILGNKKRMIQWQDDFYACMSERWPELERGAPAVETKRKHLTPQWYKKVTAMDTKLERLETALNGINALNAGKKREEAVALLAQLLPEVESFQAEIQRMQQAVLGLLSIISFESSFAAVPPLRSATNANAFFRRRNTAPQAGQICSGSCCINGVSHRTQYSSPAIQSASFLLGPGETVAFGTAVGES